MPLQRSKFVLRGLYPWHPWRDWKPRNGTYRVTDLNGGQSPLKSPLEVRIVPRPAPPHSFLYYVITSPVQTTNRQVIQVGKPNSSRQFVILWRAISRAAWAMCQNLPTDMVISTMNIKVEMSRSEVCPNQMVSHLRTMVSRIHLLNEAYHCGPSAVCTFSDS